MGIAGANWTNECLQEELDFLCKMHKMKSRTEAELYFNISPEWKWASFTFYTLLCTFGICGNILTIVMFARYIKRTTTSVFIIALAVVDLLVCTLPMIMTIYSLFSFEMSNIVCLLDNYIRYFAIVASGIILLIIAVDRFLLIFFVNTTIMTQLRAKIIIVVAMLFCLGLTAPQLLSQTTIVYTDDLFCDGELICDTGICQSTKDKDLWKTVYDLSVAYLILFWVLVVSFIVIYSLIFFKIYKMYQKMSGWSKNKRPESRSATINTEITDDHLTFASDGDTTRHENTTPPADENMNSGKENNGNLSVSNVENENLVNARKTSSKKSHKIPKRRKKLPHLHTALTLFLITMTFVAAYIYVTIMIFSDICNTSDGKEFSEKTSSVTCNRATAVGFFWHLFYLNHVINPVIYSFMNPRFKEALRSILKRCMRRQGS